MTTIWILTASSCFAASAYPQCHGALPTVNVSALERAIDLSGSIVHGPIGLAGAPADLAMQNVWCGAGDGHWSFSRNPGTRWFGVSLANRGSTGLRRVLSIDTALLSHAQVHLIVDGVDSTRRLMSGAEPAQGDIGRGRLNFALTIPAAHKVSVVMKLRTEGTRLGARLDDFSTYVASATERNVIVSLIIGGLLCTVLFQLLLVAGSGEQRALTVMVLSVFAYEFVALGYVFVVFGEAGMALARYTFQFECLLLIAATSFTASFFDLRITHEKLHSLFQVAYGIQGLMLLFSLLNGTLISRAMPFIALLPVGLIVAAAVCTFREARAATLGFILSCTPTAAGAMVSGAMASGSIAWNPLFAYATDAGLVLSTFMFVVMVSRRLERRRDNGEKTLRHTQRRYQLALEGSNDGIFEWDFGTQTVLASERAYEILGLDYTAGWSPQHLWQESIPESELDRIYSMPEALLSGENAIRIETWCLDHHGEKRFLLVKGKLDRDASGQPARVIGSVSDISEQKRLEDRLRHDALHDFLTGLPNRTLLTDRMRRVVERLKRNPEACAALLFIGLDNFKTINDNLGHGFGDQVLVSLADRLVEFVRSSDTVARFGGDEFVILLEDMLSLREAERFANRILTRIQAPLEIQGHHLVLSVSIGTTIVEDPSAGVETVLGDADIAMYTAKERGKGRVVAFETTMRTRAARRMQLETALHNAMEKEELYLAFQPIFALEGKTPQAVGVEALLRWKQAERTDIAPSELLSLAEETGAIQDIGKWVIRTAARQLAEWRAMNYPDDFYVNINLSPVHFENEDIVSTILKEVDPLGIPRNALRIEIVETAVIRHPEKALSVIKLLQSQGILVSIDDFGTGFSSLSYLHRFPFYALKIDRSFVLDIVESKATRDIITAIVVLARRLGIKVVAEGIENDAQLDFLRNVGCDLGQGFLLARPAGSVDRWFAAAEENGRQEDLLSHARMASEAGS